MQIPEEIYCPECKLHSCPEVLETPKKVMIVCFWCDNVIRTELKTLFRFGKHKGETIADCTDLNYLIWMREKFRPICGWQEQMMKEVIERIDELE